MPYWSSSRVGIVPQGQPTKAKKRTERYNGNKGITMEDLKKQTALRLAKEQQEQQSREVGGNTTAFTPPSNPARPVGVEGRPRGISSLGGQPHHVAPSPYHNPPQYLAGQPMYHAPPREQPPRVVEPVARMQYQPANPRSIRNEDDRAMRPVLQVPQGYMTQEHHGREYQSPGPAPSHSSSSSLASNSQAASSKSKLPHGLTVHELKEMTKARLQAEAAEKRDTSVPVREPGRAAPSPVPPGFHTKGSNGAASPFERVDPRSFSSQGRDGWTHESRADAWETASVSTVASDYYGSESAYSSGLNGSSAELAAFERERTYSTNSVPHEPPVFVAGSSSSLQFASNTGLGGYENGHSSGSQYDCSAFVGNRRRAATLSPRLHESRQYMDSQGDLLPGLPSFASPPSRQLTPRNRSVAGADGYRFVHNPPPGGVEGNRARTSSAASLPAFSNTAEEFCMDFGSSSGLFDVLREDEPSMSVTGLSNVFRDSPSRLNVSAPPGFVGGSELQFSTSSIGYGSSDTGDARVRAATWSEPSSAGMFGPGLLSGGAKDDLADDLASILNLSGADEKDSVKLFMPPGL